MAGKVAFELVSPEKLLASIEADMVTVPGSEGDFGVLPNHVPMISTLRPGVITVDAEGGERTRYMVAGGFVEVTRSRCTVLVEDVVPLGEVSIDLLDGRLKAAEEALADAENAAAKRVASAKIDIILAQKRAFIHYAAH